MEAQAQLVAQGYPRAKVEGVLGTPVHYAVDLHLNVKSGALIRVREVTFTHDDDLKDAELRRSLRSLRIRRVLFWKLHAGYSEAAVNSDIARVQSLYLSKGFTESTVRLGDSAFGDKSASINIAIDAGPRKSEEPGALCASLFAQRRAAQREGVLEFVARVNESETEPAIQLGPVYRVGRIDFIGHHRYGDSTIRQAFVLDEGALFDEQRLRKSFVRLNQANLFEPLTDRDISIRTHPESGIADIRVRLTERKRGAWNLSGPVGPASVAGALQASISSRLPPWGAGLFRLSTYTASISLFAFRSSDHPRSRGDPEAPPVPGAGARASVPSRRRAGSPDS